MSEIRSLRYLSAEIQQRVKMDQASAKQLKPFINQVLYYMKGEDEEERGAACRVMDLVPIPISKSHFKEALESEFSDVVVHAIKRFGVLELVSELTSISGLLKHQDDDVFAAAANVVAGFKVRKSVQKLTTYLDGKPPEERIKKVLEAMHSVGDIRKKAVYEPYLTHPNPSIRAEAINGMIVSMWFPAKRVLPFLETETNDIVLDVVVPYLIEKKPKLVFKIMLERVASCTDKALKTALFFQLEKNENPKANTKALAISPKLPMDQFLLIVNLFEQVDDPRILPQMVDRLQAEEDPFIQQELISYMGTFGVEENAEVVEQFVDGNVIVQYAAVLSLCQLTPNMMKSTALSHILKSDDPDKDVLKQVILQYLYERYRTHSMEDDLRPLIVATLHSTNLNLRMLSAKVVSRYQLEESIPELISRLKVEQDPDIKRNCVKSVVSILHHDMARWLALVEDEFDIVWVLPTLEAIEFSEEKIELLMGTTILQRCAGSSEVHQSIAKQLFLGHPKAVITAFLEEAFPEEWLRLLGEVVVGEFQHVDVELQPQVIEFILSRWEALEERLVNVLVHNKMVWALSICVGVFMNKKQQNDVILADGIRRLMEISQ